MSQAALRQHIETLPVGDAVVRLMRVQYQLLSLPHGVTNARLLQESAALTEALNRLTINLGFECILDENSTLIEDAKRAPESTPVEIMRRGAETSCCRIVPVESPIGDATKPTKTRSTSRSRD